MHAHIAFLFSLLLVLAPACLADAHGDVIQSAVAAPGRSDADRNRDLAEKPASVLEFFSVRPGMRIVDLMSGDGYYAEILAGIVGATGEVVAWNNAAYVGFLGEAADRRFAGGRLANVSRRQAELDAMQLGDNSYDMVLMVMAYHDIYWVDDDWPAVDVDNFFAQLQACLKPGGVVAIVDHSAVAGTGTSMVDGLHRIDPDFARRDLERHGFVFEGESELLRNPGDDRSTYVYDDRIRRKTDRFIYRFRKPAS